MKDAILSLVQWAGAHPQLAGLLVALIACAESLAFIGLVVPGAVMMLGTGALIGVGALDFWGMLAWAVGGAVVGDGLSYWLGHHYQDELTRLRFVRRHSELIERGETFLKRHGGKSILLARFVGPVRPVLPVVAGMLGMSPTRFFVNNVLSALAWAPSYLIPGMAFGASLALAGQVAGRLALGLSILIVSVWILTWGVRSLYQWLQPHTRSWASRGLSWGRSHPRLAWLVADLLDPAQPVSRPLLLWLGLLVAGSWLFFGVLEDVLELDPLVYAGQSFYHLLQQLRTPDGDRIMVMLTEMGDAAVTIPVIVAVFLWLLWARAWRDALFWFGAVGFGVLAVASIKFALRIPRPIELYLGTDSYSFPSGHATLSTVVYGFLAVLSARSLASRWRWLPYTLAALLVSGIAFSRLYLGAHWLADVAAGVGLGTAWVAVLAIARTHNSGAQGAIRGLPQVALIVFLISAAWHVHNRLAIDLERYAVRVPLLHMGEQQWWETGWRSLPAYRLDLEGELEQPLNFQWAGELEVLRQMLVSKGWHEPLDLNPRSAMRWLLPKPSIAEVPVVPQLHNGRYEALILVHRGDPKQQLILRLWSSSVRLQGHDTLLWLGTAAWQRIERLPLVSFPRNANGYDDALARLRSVLTNQRWRMEQRRLDAEEDSDHWSGETLLAASRLDSL